MEKQLKQKNTVIESKKDLVHSDKSLKTMANSIYQTLKSEGCEHKDIIGVSSQLIGLVTEDMDDRK